MSQPPSAAPMASYSRSNCRIAGPKCSPMTLSKHDFQSSRPINLIRPVISFCDRIELSDEQARSHALEIYPAAALEKMRCATEAGDGGLGASGQRHKPAETTGLPRHLERACGRPGSELDSA